MPGARGLALLLALLLLPALPPAGAAGDGFRQGLVVEVQGDRTEILTLAYAQPAGYSHRHERFPLPDGATPQRIVDEEGEVAFRVFQEAGHTYASFTARSASFTVHMKRGPPDEATRPLYRRNASLPAFEGAPNHLDVTVRVPPGFSLFYASPGAALAPDGRTVTLTADDPVFLRYAYEAPLPHGSGIVAFHEPPFRVFAPAAHETAAREVAQLTAPLVAGAARETGFPLPTGAFRVRFAPDQEFGWEAGHYAGSNLITMRETALDTDPATGFPYRPASTLLHEAVHAITGYHGYGPFGEGISWFVEGAAVHAQRRVWDAHPGAATWCDGAGTCWFFEEGITREEVEAAYGSTWRFDPAWTPRAPQDDATREFYYGYTGFLVGAYIQRFGGDAYRAVWADVQGAMEDDSVCPCDAAWLTRALLRHAGGGVTEDALYHPFRDLLREDPAAFRAATANLLSEEPDAAALRGWADPLNWPGLLADAGARAWPRLVGPLREADPAWAAAAAGGLGALALGVAWARRRRTPKAQTCPRGHPVAAGLPFCPSCGEDREEETGRET